MVVGRGLCGSSVGMLSTAIPVYQAEMSIPSIRGRLVSLYQWAITWGILLAFWGSYGFRNVEGDASWRIPLGLQAIPAAMLMIWMSFLPYSPRWLVDHYRTSEAHAVLAYLRANGSLTDVLVIEELHEIMMAVKLERDTSMHGYGELVKKPIRRRLIIGIGIQLLQQLTGINIIMYYAPVFFQWLSFTVNDEPFVAQGVVGIVNMLATIPTIIWVDKWGRRPIIILGSALCGLFMILFAVSIATESIDFNRVHLDDVEASKSLSHNLRNLALASIYLFIASFAFSWGVMGWLLPSEIFPMHMRSKANSITAASNWILNFALDFATPFTLCNYPSAIIIVVGGIMVVSAVMLYLIFPETKNRSLEDMELLFTGSLLAFRKPKVIEMGSQYSDRSLSYPKL
ncbi:hypothetical protein H4219_002315 [Mycoemilia scoparia]|uniref:Major facilitator superfamily (MFS) profile domain-containing protein n=1 Tax=Mycoemilia scoparia TaxID=417184 RepID=A0A9W8A3K3_9FUNG|nr:hypothetical protein H4219_002315 [Mycoemilia scoparia]